jgi:hypothetical protein
MRELATASATPGLPIPVRRAISRMVLDLREAIEDDYRKQLRALGIGAAGIGPIPSGRALAADEARVREVATAVVAQAVAAGSTAAEAVEGFVRESAFTFLNRAIGFRCLEERGLLLVDGQSETLWVVDAARNASSLYWRVRTELPPATPPREIWRAALRRASEGVSQQVRVLFDPDSEYAALLPLQPTLAKVADALNAVEIPPETYRQDELLGWVYQYYNTREKDAVYERLGKGKKIERAEELAAATCLYTERYMVDYLLQNTLGALWVELHPESRLPEGWAYFVRNGPLPLPPPLRGEGVKTEGPAERPDLASSDASAGNGSARSISGASQETPPRVGEGVGGGVRRLRDITLLDPACGSGHFLVRAFDLFAAMYAEEGIERAEEIPQLILANNLHGIDIDARSIQIAALALYLKGCALGGPGFRPRRLNLVPADAVLPGDSPPAAYIARFQGNKEDEDLVKGIWRALKNVRELGSLLHPERAVDEVVKRRRERERGTLWEADEAQWEQWKEHLLEGLREEFERQAQTSDLGQRLFGEEAAKGVSLVEALGRKYDVVVANPPYQGSGSLNEGLKTFLAKEYKDGKSDLYAAFILRCRDFARLGGTVGMVTQQSWMFLRTFAALRKDVLERTSLTTIAHLGPRAFTEISGEVVNIALFTLRPVAPTPEHCLVGLRLVGPKSPAEKERMLLAAVGGQASGVVSKPRQAELLLIPEVPLAYWLSYSLLRLFPTSPKLGAFVGIKAGLKTGDDDRFVRYFWEVENFQRWPFYLKGGGYARWCGFEQLCVFWADGVTPYLSYVHARPRDPEQYFRAGYTYAELGRGSIGVRVLPADSIFGNMGPGLFPRPIDSWVAIDLNTHLMSYLLRSVSASLHVLLENVASLPIVIPTESRKIELNELVRQATTSKASVEALDLCERRYIGDFNPRGSESLLCTLQSAVDVRDRTMSTLLALEGAIEELVRVRYGISRDDVIAIALSANIE